MPLKRITFQIYNKLVYLYTSCTNLDILQDIIKLKQYKYPDSFIVLPFIFLLKTLISPIMMIRKIKQCTKENSLKCFEHIEMLNTDFSTECKMHIYLWRVLHKTHISDNISKLTKIHQKLWHKTAVKKNKITAIFCRKQQKINTSQQYQRNEYDMFGQVRAAA